jgi:uncharacterized protein (TIGR02246 family)
LTAELEELREQVRELRDREEIRNLIQEYRRTLDQRDLRGFSALFAQDGSWSGRSGQATGPEGIYTMLVGQLPDNPPAPASTLWHLNTDPAITVDGDHATASTFWMHARRGEGDTLTLPTLGSYDDTLVRENGRWRFARRRVNGLIPA